ncbi:hypothetical protein ANN_06923 [Periplaneta americana]|uniref:Uncharacterized protein n=1 Tax=Periplaneta americana TaxID=6978 RepID=A0ABQ8TFL5_PERAM|nr:hypothetical protein ANN_06923 [Periplaneta americana]
MHQTCRNKNGYCPQKYCHKERLCGKSPDVLTVEKIDRVTKYYRSAIYDNVRYRGKMKRSIYAILDHCRATDQVPRHTKCPVVTSDPDGILPVVLYGCETWTLTLREEHRLRVFENKVLRKIFGAKRDEVTGEWRKLHNAELHALYSSPDIIRNIKSRRLRWAGHVARMGDSRNAYRVTWWEYIGEAVRQSRLFSLLRDDVTSEALQTLASC